MDTGKLYSQKLIPTANFYHYISFSNRQSSMIKICLMTVMEKTSRCHKIAKNLRTSRSADSAACQQAILIKLVLSESTATYTCFLSTQAELVSLPGANWSLGVKPTRENIASLLFVEIKKFLNKIHLPGFDPSHVAPMALWPSHGMDTILISLVSK